MGRGLPAYVGIYLCHAAATKVIVELDIDGGVGEDLSWQRPYEGAVEVRFGETGLSSQKRGEGEWHVATEGTGFGSVSRRRVKMSCRCKVVCDSTAQRARTPRRSAAGESFAWIAVPALPCPLMDPFHQHRYHVPKIYPSVILISSTGIHFVFIDSPPSCLSKKLSCLALHKVGTLMQKQTQEYTDEKHRCARRV